MADVKHFQILIQNQTHEAKPRFHASLNPYCWKQQRIGDLNSEKEMWLTGKWDASPEGKFKAGKYFASPVSPFLCASVRVLVCFCARLSQTIVRGL